MARDEEKRRRRREEQPEREESSRAERAQQGTGRPTMQREDTQPTGAPSWMQGGQQRTGVDAYGQTQQMGTPREAGRMQEPPVVTEPQSWLPSWTREAQGTQTAPAEGLPPAGQEIPAELPETPRHEPKIGAKEIADAAETLRKYKAGKANLEARIIDNEQWWKLRHWQSIRHGGDRDPKPTSAWLVNACLAKHADAMAAYPEANMLPREPGDRDEAKRLSSIVPVILQQADYEMTWSDCWWKKIKSGVGVTGVFWDPGKLNGMGDITIREVDPLCVFWEPGVTDIQESSHFFQTQLVPNDRLEAAYPELAGRLTGQSLQISEYIYDDSVDTFTPMV